jgi:hypothetical protein
MAEMIPPTFTGRYSSEKKVYELLKRLPDDCLVYYEPRVDDRYPDFVAIIPNLGVLVLEVKGWRAHEILGADSHRVQHKAFGKEQCATHPSRQARKYRERLMQTCKSLTWGDCLLEKEGRYKGGFRFPFSHAVILTNIGCDELDEMDPAFRGVFPESDTLTRDTLDSLLLLEGAALQNAFARYFKRLFSCAMTEAQIKVLRAVMNPVVLIGEPRREDATDIKVLDIAQETKARCLPDGHQVIYGVAGSGKTVIAIARAKHLAEDAERRILVLCFNNPLMQCLRTALRDARNVDVFTFHGWALRNSLEWIDDESDEDHARRFLAAFEHGMVNDAGRYDAVIVDEAQLLPRDWLKCACLALKEQSADTASLLIVGDGTQSFFRKRPFAWKEAGIAAAGRTTILKRNYRNTEEIVRIAYRFAAPVHPEGEDGPRRATPMPECLRTGPAPELISLRNKGEECDYAATLIRCWLMGGMMIRGRRETILPRDVAVLFPRPGPQPTALAEKLNIFTKAVVLQTHTDQLDQDAVRIISVKRATGLQFRIVILLWTHLMHRQYPDQEDNALLYMAMTRAEDVLVILHSGASGLIAKIGAALEANGAPGFAGSGSTETPRVLYPTGH